jgi:hypothetical protein
VGHACFWQWHNGIVRHDDAFGVKSCMEAFTDVLTILAPSLVVVSI